MMFTMESNWGEVTDVAFARVQDKLGSREESSCQQTIFARQYPDLTLGEFIEQFMLDPHSGWNVGWSLQSAAGMWDLVNDVVRERLVRAVLILPSQGYILLTQVPDLPDSHKNVIAGTLEGNSPHLFEKAVREGLLDADSY